MPYINERRREWLDPFISNLSAEMLTHGELNYCVTRLAVLFLAPLVAQGKKVGYGELSAVRAVLQDAADEFYREPVADYEDKKMQESGDVYAELRNL